MDELDYLPLDGRCANLFFQLVAARYTRGSLLITSNVAFDGWGKLFGDDVIASAILDRLLHHSEIFAVNGPSYRLKDKLGSGSLDRRPATDTMPATRPGWVNFARDTWVSLQSDTTPKRSPSYIVRECRLPTQHHR